MALQGAPSRAGLPSTGGAKQLLRARRVQKSRVGLARLLLLRPPVAYACLPHLPTEWGEGSTDGASLFLILYWQDVFAVMLRQDWFQL